MHRPEVYPDGTYIYRDDDRNINLAVKDHPIYDEDTSEIIGYETVTADIPSQP